MSRRQFIPGKRGNIKNLLKNIYLCQNNVNPPPISAIPFIGNGYTYTFDNGVYAIRFENNGSIQFLNNCNIRYTLVGGGGGGGGSSSFSGGQSGGGGGHVLNNTTGINVNNGNTWNITIGNGGPINYSLNNGIGQDTQIQSNSSIIATTNNLLYSGGGGLGAVNYSSNGGGGPGNNITSANGGNYFKWVYFSITYGLGGGGGGGSLTNGPVTILGGNGLTALDNPVIVADGGDGQRGIDGNWYGGGGGGGVQDNNFYFQSGQGGLGGGGGGYSLYTTYPINGENNTGGGGGGGGNGSISIPSGNGGSGIVILLVTIDNDSTNSCELYENCQCIQEKVNRIKTGFNDPVQTQSNRITQIITGTLGGKTTYGNFGVPANITYLGGSEGQPGGSPRPLRNKF